MKKDEKVYEKMSTEEKNRAIEEFKKIQEQVKRPKDGLKR